MLLENNVYPQDVRVRSEAQSLVKAGHHVTVVAPRGDGQARRDRVGGVRVRRFTLPKTPATALGYLIEYAIANARLYLAGAWQLIRGARVVHMHNPPDTLFGVAFLARALGRDVVFDHHDLGPELFEAKFGKGGIGARLMRLFERLSFRSATLVVAPTSRTRKSPSAGQRAGQAHRGRTQRAAAYGAERGDRAARWRAHRSPSSLPRQHGEPRRCRRSGGHL